MKNIINPKILFALAVIIIFISIGSFYFSDIHILFELFTHFQLQYALVVLGLLIMNIFYFKIQTKHYTNITYIIYLIFVFLFFLFPINLFGFGMKKADIFFMNTNYFVNNNKIISEHILNNEYPVVAVVEPNAQIIEKLSLKYGSPDIYTDQGAKSCAIFSEKKSKFAQIIDLNYPVCFAEFEEYKLYVIHPLPPINSKLMQAQKLFFKDLKTLLDEDIENEKKFIIVGDFNSSYYSKTFRKYFEDYFHKHYYTRTPYFPFAIPIDHGLANFPIKVNMGKKYTSDHKYLEIEFY